MVKRHKKKIIASLVVLVVALGGFFVYDHFWKEPEVIMNLNSGDQSFIKDMSEEELRDFLQDQADEDYVRLKLDTTMRFDTSDKPGSVNIQNPPSNEYAIEVTTYIEGEDDEIYISGVIQPEQYVSEGKLLRKVAKGTYKTISTVQFLDSEKNVVGTSSVVGKLTVES
ncbi:hypothetical protein P742_0102560 [Enterococcus faecium UC8668]|nr:hypothetical protein P742_0102560 [Enterococcus faecium UC8668]